jgi:hypothetical protein
VGTAGGSDTAEHDLTHASASSTTGNQCDRRGCGSLQNPTCRGSIRIPTGGRRGSAAGRWWPELPSDQGLPNGANGRGVPAGPCWRLRRKLTSYLAYQQNQDSGSV